MRFFAAWRRGTKGPSADSPPDLWLSSPGSAPGGTTRPASPVSPLDLVAPLSRTERRQLFLLVLACVFTFLLLLSLVLGAVFILLTSWEIERKATAASLKDVSAWESDWDGWMARRLFCSASLPCDAYSPFSADGHFLWKYEMTLPKEQTWTL